MRLQSKARRRVSETPSDRTSDGRLAWELLAGSRTLLVATHANPDADAVASVLALRLVLAEHVQSAVCLTGDGLVPPNLEFLPGAEHLLRDPTSVTDPPDCIALVDCADPTRLGPLFRLHPTWFDGHIPIINIDHHVTNTRYGSVDLVDPASAATTEVIAHWLEELEQPIVPDVATCLLTGLYGDTLSFQTTSTSARVFQLAARLLEAGARQVDIVIHLFRSKPLSTVQLWGAALSRVRCEPPLIWTEITHRMLEEAGASAVEGEGIVNFLVGTHGTSVALLFYEQSEGWRVSLRSADGSVDVARLCQRYGGGGHPRAAGCRLPPGEATRRSFLDDLAAQVSALLSIELPSG